MAPTLTRRQALAAGAAGAAVALAGGAGLVQAGVLPGRYRVGRLLGACDVGGPPPTTAAPGPLRFASFPSRRRGRPVGYGVAWPPGSGPGDRLPVCLLLHAAAGNERTPFERLRLHHHLAQATGPPVPRGTIPTVPRTPPAGCGRSPWPRPTAGAAAGARPTATTPSACSWTSCCRCCPASAWAPPPARSASSAGRWAAAAPSAWPRPTPAAWPPWSPPARPWPPPGPRSPARAAWPAWPSRSTAAPTTRSPRPPGPWPPPSPAPRSPSPRAATTAASGSAKPPPSCASWPPPSAP